MKTKRVRVADHTVESLEQLVLYLKDPSSPVPAERIEPTHLRVFPNRSGMTFATSRWRSSSPKARPSATSRKRAGSIPAPSAPTSSRLCGSRRS